MIKLMDNLTSARLHIDQHLLHGVLLGFGVTMFDFSILTQTDDKAVVYIATRSYPTDRYILRLRRVDQDIDRDLDKTTSYLQYLYSQSLPVPKIHEVQDGLLSNSFHANDSEWRAVLLDFCDGHTISTYTPLALERMAALQGSLHVAGDRFGLAQSSHVRELSLLPGLDGHKNPPPQHNDKRVFEFYTRAAAYAVPYEVGLQRGYTYNYYDADQVIIDDGYTIRGVVMFDSLMYTPTVSAVAYTLWHVLYMSSDWRLVQHYLHHYQSTRLLSEKEHAYLTPSMLAYHYQSFANHLASGLPLDHGNFERYLGLEQYLLSAKTIMPAPL